jgi:transcriptional regulator with XRE-family HTH domain
MTSFPCRIRKYRKSSPFTQRELADLVGMRSQGATSQIEAGHKRPSTRIAIGYEAILGAPLQELFPQLYEEATYNVLINAQILYARIAKDRRRATAAAYLAALISRLDGANSQSCQNTSKPS